METLDRFLELIIAIINLMASSKGIVISLGGLFIGSTIYYLGKRAGQRSGPPQVKIKLKDSYSLDEIDNLAVKPKDQV